MNKSLNRSGFTLIEIMVAVSIFSMVVLVAIGAVLAIVSANKRAQALNSVIANLNFAVEGMVRDLRTGYDYHCGNNGDITTPTPLDCVASGDDIVYFYSAQYGKVIAYGFGGSCPNGLFKRDGGIDYCITGEDVRIEGLRFYVAGSLPASSGDYNQAKILMTIGGNFVGYGSLGDFNLQSTVTQRKLDI